MHEHHGQEGWRCRTLQRGRKKNPDAGRTDAALAVPEYEALVGRTGGTLKSVSLDVYAQQEQQHRASQVQCEQDRAHGEITGAGSSVKSRPPGPLPPIRLRMLSGATMTSASHRASAVAAGPGNSLSVTTTSTLPGPPATIGSVRENLVLSTANTVLRDLPMAVLATSASFGP